MALITRILCPTDFSSAAARALRYAEQLAQVTGAELLLAHAFDRPAELTFAGQSIPSDPELWQKLNGVGSSLPDVRIRRLLHVGSPGEVICWLASSEKCDLIVLGTHGRTGLRHLVLGSVAEYVVRHAACPVITLREPAPHEAPPREPRVLPVPAPRLM